MRADFILAGDGSTSPHLTDGAIELRPLQCRDAETHVALEDEAWIRWLSDEPGTAESTREWIRRNLLSWASHGSVHNFGIWSAATGQLLGNIEANTSVDVPGVRSGQANVSYALGALARGQGHATRAVELICTYLTEIGYSGALICTDQANESSTRVAQRAGFTLTGERVVRDGHELQCLRRAL